MRWEQDRRKTLQLAEENESAEELWTKAETKLSECSKFDVSEWWEYCRYGTGGLHECQERCEYQLRIGVGASVHRRRRVVWEVWHDCSCDWGVRVWEQWLGAVVDGLGDGR